MSDLLSDWNEGLSEWEEIPSMDEDGYSNKEIDTLINQHFGSAQAQPEASKVEVEITKTIPLTKQDKPAKMVVVKEKGNTAPEKEKKNMAARRFVPVMVDGEKVAQVKVATKAQLAAGALVTPHAGRGRPSRLALATRAAELEAGFVLPVKNVNPEGQRGRPRKFAKISVADLARANAALEAAGEAVIEL